MQRAGSVASSGFLVIAMTLAASDTSAQETAGEVQIDTLRDGRIVISNSDLPARAPGLVPSLV